MHATGWAEKMKHLIKPLLAVLVAGMMSSTFAYELIEPIPSAARRECWANQFPQHSEIVGYSRLGHVFMRDPASDEYIVLHPFKGAAKSYGSFESAGEFEASVLKDAGFMEYVLRPSHVAAIRERLGSLDKDQVYIPQPYPFIGGDESVESYDKGDIWVMLQIVGQMGGICP